MWLKIISLFYVKSDVIKINVVKHMSSFFSFLFFKDRLWAPMCSRHLLVSSPAYGIANAITNAISTIINLCKLKLFYSSFHHLAEMGHSNSLAKSSLWTDLSSAGPSSAGAAGLSVSRPQPSVSSAKRPAFNSSYFGSPKMVSPIHI